LRTAAEVREAYWQWQRSRVEASLAREREGNARQLAADVAKRVKSGELALADQHQAEGAAALAEIEAARAKSALATAAQQLRSLIGTLPSGREEAAPGVVTGEPVPALPADFAVLDAQHPAVSALLDQAEVARRSAELARVQTRANPELTLSTSREREPGESYDESLTLGIRIPFGSGSRNRAKQATAEAEAIEAEVQARLARERLLGELEAARLAFESARAQMTAAEKRARLAQESRGFFENPSVSAKPICRRACVSNSRRPTPSVRPPWPDSIRRRRSPRCVRHWVCCPNKAGTNLQDCKNDTVSKADSLHCSDLDRCRPPGHSSRRWA
jgi:outer membrane protein TolC